MKPSDEGNGSLELYHRPPTGRSASIAHPALPRPASAPAPDDPRSECEAHGVQETAAGATGATEVAFPRDKHWWNTVARYVQTGRHYRPSQLLYRGLRRAQHAWLAMRGVRKSRRPTTAPLQRRDNPGLVALLEAKADRAARSASAESAQRVLRGRFRFLGAEVELPDPVDWLLACAPELPRLWRFHLHYHDFLLDLVAAADSSDAGDPYLRRAWHLAADWAERVGPCDVGNLLDAWHPYCISRRLLNWVLLWTACPPPTDRRAALGDSLCAQAWFLERHLEKDIGGNHLLENARALVLAGAFCESADAERWLRKGQRILEREIGRQILPWGEHFERSPMYHAQMLELFLDVRDAARHVAPELSGRCGAVATRMAHFLREIARPDGQIPLLGDSALDGAARPANLLHRAGLDAPTAGSDGPPPPAPPARLVSQSDRASARVVGDYWLYRDQDNAVIFDAGPVGADHLPAHAHADLLGFEASVCGRRLLVDSGVFGYEDDAMRGYCRSTAAHNALVIDGLDQCDMWSRFRMGYRGWSTGPTCGESDGFHWARSSHNAYRRTGVPVVGRWIACRPGGPWIWVDWARGSGTHRLASWLHFHPEATLRLQSPGVWLVGLAGFRARLRPLMPGDVQTQSAWYCPEFGRRVAAPGIRWSASVRMPAACGWCLTWDGCDGLASLEQDAAGHPLLRWTEADAVSVLEPLCPL